MRKSGSFIEIIFSGRKYLGNRKPIYLVVMNAYRKASDGKYTNTVCYPDVKVRIGSIQLAEVTKKEPSCYAVP